MAGVPVPAYKRFWTDKRLSLNTQYKDIANTYPDATPTIQQLLKVLCDIENLANSTPISVGERKEWDAIISSAEDNREDYCKVLKGETPFSALYGIYTMPLHDLKKVLKDSTRQEDCFNEVHRRKRHCNEEPIQSTTKVDLPTSTVKVATKNFFGPLRTNNMDTDTPDTESTTTEKAVQEKLGRPPPIVLTSANNLIQLQKQLKGVAKDTFEFRSTKNGTRIVTKNMVDYQSVKTYFESKTYPTIHFTLNRKN
jgi:hypothetical protein